MAALDIADIYHRDMSVALLQRDAGQYPFIFKCEQPECNWHTAHASWGQAANTRLIHRAGTCPLDGRSKIAKNGVAVGSSIIEKFWNDLDKVTVVLVGTPEGQRATEEYRVARGQAQGIAQCIWHISQPHFETVMDVKKWAMRRYKMEHTEGFEFAPTPGVEGYNPPVPANVQMQPSSPAKRPAAKRAAPAASGTEELASMPDDKKLLATNAIKAGFPKDKILTLAKISGAAFDALQAEVNAAK